MNHKSVQKFGFWSIVLLAINSIIGTGIFLTPGEVLSKAGTWTPLVYAVAAIFASILGITFASAAKYVNKNGAAYAYATAAFGRNVGYYVGITRYVAASIAWGVMGTAVVRTALTIFMGADGITNTHITVGFVVLMSVLLLINLMGTRIIKIMSNISTVGKVLALTVAVLAGFIIFIKTGVNHFDEVSSLVQVDMTVTTFVGAVMAAFYAFTGFESVASASSEMIEPEKNLPRAIPLALLIIALIYISIVGIAMVINPSAILQSKEVVVLAAAYTNPLIKNIIVYGALISMFGINIAASFGTPRVLEALALEHQVPPRFAKKSKRDVPVLSFVMTAFLAVVIPMSFQYDMRGIMVISSVSRFIQFIVVPCAVLSFYKGNNNDSVLKDAQKNRLTDLIIPIIALAMTALLLIKFNWRGQFSVINPTTGQEHLNLYAVMSMFIGYVILPIGMYFYTQSRNKKEQQR